MMNVSEYENAIEAILFAGGEPVRIDRIAGALGISASEAGQLALHLADTCNARPGGLQILVLGDSVQLATRPEYEEAVRAAMDTRRNAPLSGAALEVLAVIAYNQPVTRPYIEQVRGVDCGSSINTLIEKGLVQECGRLNVAGRPMLFKTTENFLRCFGFSSLTDMPELSLISAEREPRLPEAPAEMPAAELSSPDVEDGAE